MCWLLPCTLPSEPHLLIESFPTSCDTLEVRRTGTGEVLWNWPHASRLRPPGDVLYAGCLRHTRTRRGGPAQTTLPLLPASPCLLMESRPLPGSSPSFCVLSQAHFSLIQRAR